MKILMVNKFLYPRGGCETYMLNLAEELKAKGHDPIIQIVGYIISGDPTYITSYNNARSLIKRLERDEILEEFVRFYVENHDD